MKLNGAKGRKKYKNAEVLANQLYTNRKQFFNMRMKMALTNRNIYDNEVKWKITGIK